MLVSAINKNLLRPGDLVYVGDSIHEIKQKKDHQEEPETLEEIQGDEYALPFVVIRKGIRYKFQLAELLCCAEKVRDYYETHQKGTNIGMKYKNKETGNKEMIIGQTDRNFSILMSISGWISLRELAENYEFIEE